MLESILVALSFGIGLLVVQHLRRFDLHEQEPFGAMAAVALCGGILSILISFFLYRMLHANGIHIRAGIPSTLIFVGLVEEAAKLAALFFCLPIIRREMDEPTDGLIYMACVALGFSLIENWFYATTHPLQTGLIAIRLVICTPMHIAFSIIMGLAFFWTMRFKGGWGVLLLAYLFASAYHALYDILASQWILLPALYLVVKGGYLWMYRLLGYTAAISPFRRPLAETLLEDGRPALEEGLECLDCGNRAPKPTSRRGRIRVQRCEACGAYLCSPSDLAQIVHQYGSLFGSLKRRSRRLSRHRKNLWVLVDGNRIDRKKQVACFRLDEFSDVLEKLSQEVRKRTERAWWFPLRVEHQLGGD